MNVTRFTILLLAAGLLTCGCMPKITVYSHDIPEYCRTASYPVGIADCVAAAVTVLENSGFAIALQDAEAGIVVTRPLTMPPPDPEVGGEWEVIYFLKFKELTEKTMVTAEIVVQGGVVKGSTPIAMGYDQARDLYRDLFREIQHVVDEASGNVGR